MRPVVRFGQASADAEQSGDAPQLVVPASAQVPAPQPAGTLDELIATAVAHHPEVRAAHARVEAARGRMVQAGLYPNPILGPNLGQFGDRATHIGEGGGRFIQTFVPPNKLRTAKEAAAHGVEAADWQAVTKWHDTILRVRLAYYEVLTALRELDTIDAIVGVSAEAHKAARLLEDRGVGSRPDVLRAKVELEQNALRKEVAQRRVEAARQNLHTALGRPPGFDQRRITAQGKELLALPPDYEWSSTLARMLETSSVLHEARALIAQQEKLLAKARADVTPNFDVQLNPFYAAHAQEFRVQLIATAPVPFFDRNQGNIHAAEAERVRAVHEAKQVELQLTERLTHAYQRYQSARQQVRAYQTKIVPDAKTSLELIEAGYKAKDRKYDYTAVLQAQQVRFQAELAQTQALGELWRAVAEIDWLLQRRD